MIAYTSGVLDTIQVLFEITDNETETENKLWHFEQEITPTL